MLVLVFVVRGEVRILKIKVVISMALGILFERRNCKGV